MVDNEPVLNPKPLNVFVPLSSLYEQHVTPPLAQVLKNLVILSRSHGRGRSFTMDGVVLNQGLAPKCLDNCLSHTYVGIYEKYLEAIYEDVDSDKVICCQLCQVSYLVFCV